MLFKSAAVACYDWRNPRLGGDAEHLTPLMKLFVFGTCRVHDAADRLHSEYGLPIRHSMHRVHNGPQVFQMARILSGDNPLPASLTHTLSDRAFKLALKDDRFQHRIRYRHAGLGRVNADYQAYIIELSSRKDFFIRRPDGLQLTMNAMIKKDILTYGGRLTRLIDKGLVEPIAADDIQERLLSTREIHQSMRRIKSYLGERPVLWVSHANIVEPTSGEIHLRDVRANLADVVAVGAAGLGDPFFNPTDLVRLYGRERIFADDGQDLDHYSPFGVSVVSGALSRYLLPETWEGETPARRTCPPDETLSVSAGLAGDMSRPVIRCIDRSQPARLPSGRWSGSGRE